MAYCRLSERTLLATSLDAASPAQKQPNWQPGRGPNAMREARERHARGMADGDAALQLGPRPQGEEPMFQVSLLVVASTARHADGQGRRAWWFRAVRKRPSASAFSISPGAESGCWRRVPPWLEGRQGYSMRPKQIQPRVRAVGKRDKLCTRVLASLQLGLPACPGRPPPPIGGWVRAVLAPVCRGSRGPWRLKLQVDEALAPAGMARFRRCPVGGRRWTD